MQLKYFKFFYIFVFFQAVFSQPDIRFNPFDWNLYGESGSINSISFGDRYAFIGTSGSGVVRFNINNNRFEEPITTAQGLSSNFITAVHYILNFNLNPNRNPSESALEASCSFSIQF